MTKLLLAGLMAAVAVPALAQYTPAPVAPMMNDRVMTRAAVQGQVARMFARLDTNRDGIILKAEADVARQGMRGNRQGMRGQGMRAMHRDPAAAFARMDANRDNMISRDEFTAMHAQRANKKAAKAANGQAMRGKRGGMGGGMGLGGMMFDRADANRDGRVTLAEAQSQAFVHFDMMDANRDGQVTREERRNVRQHHMGANRG